jgi:molybdate transport system ATP-binding protein
MRRSTSGPPAGRVRGRLDARVTVRRGAFMLDVAVAADPGEVLAVIGPNGAGKSTLLSVLAGLLAPESGTVLVGGRLLTGDGVLVPPERRRVGLMGQDPLLFPHLSAVENIAFGPRSQGIPRRRARLAAVGWLERLGLAEFGTRRPAELSGGQRQRVALARALAAEPDLLLLDEPLAALDAQTAPEIRQVLRSHLRGAGTTTVLVTHDVLDAATLADRVAVLTGGTITDSGPTAGILAAPRSEFAAALAGLNLLTGTADSTAGAGAAVTVSAPGASISGLAAEPVTAGDAAAVVFPPSAVAVYLEPVAGSPRNTWPATVTALERGPSAIRLRAAVEPQLDLAAGGHGSPRGARATGDGGAAGAGSAGDPVTAVSADLTAASVAELDLHPGSRVFLSVKATEVRVHRR